VTKSALIIDADPAQTAQVERVLLASGLEVTTSMTAHEGLGHAEHHPPDLVIVSTELADMSGFGVCKRLRRTPGLERVPVVLMTGEVGREELEQHSKFRSAADAYLIKPFSGFEFWRRAKELLTRDLSVPPAPPRRTISGGVGPLVLIIDPDAEGVRQLRKVLASRQCQGIVATTGDEGIKLCEQRRPDLIIASLELGSESGFGVCKKLRRHPTLGNVPLFLVSREATWETFEKHMRLRSRADAYFRKPFVVHKFWVEVERFLPIFVPEPEDGPVSLG
jgi:DNA-binding response OmpR family regulator